VPAAQGGLDPQPHERGLAAADPREVADLLSGAWGAVVATASTADLDAPSRLPDWSVHDVLVHLGAWGPGVPMAERVSRARAAIPAPDDVDARNALVVASHHDASRAEVVAALERARDRALDFLTGPEVEELGSSWVDSPVGPLTATGLLVAQAYELAVHHLDLGPAAGPAPAALLDAGIAALVDVTGALAARQRTTATVAVLTPSGRWATGSSERGTWTTLRLADSDRTPGWPAVTGSAADVLEASAGRALAVQLVLTRRLRLQGLPGLLTLLPALEAVPGLPGGSAAQAALRAMSQTGRMVGAGFGAVGRSLGRGRAAG
jgi:uncharacterized protein (TIGR03083 family)